MVEVAKSEAIVTEDSIRSKKRSRRTAERDAAFGAASEPGKKEYEFCGRAAQEPGHFVHVEGPENDAFLASLKHEERD